MNGLDLHTFSFLNHFAHFSGILNKLLFYVSGSDLITWGPVTALLWWAWFKDESPEARTRRIVVDCLIACVALLIIFYLIQETGFSIGFQPRPMFNPQSGFQMPAGIEMPDKDSSWGTSSSFPSGHAAVLAAFSVGLLFISRRLGIFALAYSFLMCLLRVFFGMHYATDLLAGALIGALAICVAQRNNSEKLLARPVLRFSAARPPLFYTGFFLLSYGVVTGFAEARTIIHLLRTLNR